MSVSRGASALAGMLGLEAAVGDRGELGAPQRAVGEERRMVAALSEPRDHELDVPEPCRPAPAAVAVAAVDPALVPRALGGAAEGIDVKLHHPPGNSG